MAGYISQDPDVQAKVVALAAANQPQQVIADRIGIAQPTVSRMISKPELQTKIKEARDQLINNLLPKAIANVEFVVGSMQTTDDKQFKYFGYRASEKMLESVGLLSSPSIAVQFQTILNQQINVLDPRIRGLLESHGQAIDAEFEEADEASD